MAFTATNLMDKAQEILGKNQITPQTQQFDESKGVAARVNDLTTKGTPLMQTAATRASQASAARGLTNSSLAAQAGEQAVIETATPIASADASLYSQQALKNQDAINAARTNNASNAIGLSANAMGLENSNQQQDKTLAEQQRQFNTTSAQNQQQIDAQREQFNRTYAQQQQQIDAQISQFAQQLGMTEKDLQLRRDTLTSEQQRALDSLNLQKQQLSQQQTQFEATQKQNVALAQMDADLRTKLAQMDTQSKADVQGSQNIANAWGSMMQGITSIQTNPELDQETKATLIQQQMDQFGAFSNFWKKLGGGTTDVSDLLNFSSTAVPGGQSTTLPAAAPSRSESQARAGGPTGTVDAYRGGYRGDVFYPSGNTADGL